MTIVIRSSQLFFAAAAISLVSLFETTPVHADMFSDFLLFDQSYCTGRGGTHNGIGCDIGSSSDMTSQERDTLRRIEQKDAYQIAAFEEGLSASMRMIRNIDKISGQFSPVPPSPSFSADQAFNLMCLRAGLSSLILLQEDPETYKRIAQVRNGGKSSKASETREGVQFAFKHTQIVYNHAAKILFERYYFEVENLHLIERLIKSQIRPSLLQFARLTERYDLDDTGISKYDFLGNSGEIFQFAYRIGYLSDEIFDDTYMFTNRACLRGRRVNVTRSRALDNAMSRLLLKVPFLEARMAHHTAAEPELQAFNVSRIFPSSLDIQPTDFALDEERWAEYYLDWMSKSGDVSPWRQDLVDAIYRAKPGCSKSKNLTCPSLDEADIISLILFSRLRREQAAAGKDVCRSDSGEYCVARFTLDAVEEIWDKLERGKRFAEKL